MKCISLHRARKGVEVGMYTQVLWFPSLQIRAEQRDNHEWSLTFQTLLNASFIHIEYKQRMLADSWLI